MVETRTLDFLMKVRGMGFVDAVLHLTDGGVAYGQTAKEDNALAFVHLDFVLKWKQREAKQTTIKYNIIIG
jgi:hypothetical protein